MRLVREPDAGDLHVRFDERDVETELRGGYSGTATDERGGNRQTEPTATAPHLDSTVSGHSQLTLAERSRRVSPLEGALNR